METNEIYSGIISSGLTQSTSNSMSVCGEITNSVTIDSHGTNILTNDNNNSFDSAFFLGTDSIQTFNNGSLSAYEEDYYYFTLTQASVLTLTTSGNNGDTVLYLYDSNHKEIAYDDDSGDGYFSQINIELGAGTYYVKVSPYGSSAVSNYTLTSEVVIPQNIVVTTTSNAVDANDGVTSLCEALTYAQSLGGKQFISFNMNDGDTVYIDDPSLVSRNIYFAANNTANGNPVTVVLNNLNISDRNINAGVGAVMRIYDGNVSVIGGTYENNNSNGADGHAGVFYAEEGTSLTIDGAVFKNNYAFSAAGAIRSEGNITIRNSHFEGNNVCGYGGAIQIAEGATCEIIDTDFVNNTTGHDEYYHWNGGAIDIFHNSQMTYTVSAGKTINNTGNDSSFGGFMVIQNSSIEFHVDGILNIGNGDGKDSIETNPENTDSYIRKTGVGTMTINSPTSNYNDDWYIEDGVLAFTYAPGGSFSDSIIISGGQLQLGANFTFTDIVFKLEETNGTTSYINDLNKLSGGKFTVDASSASTGIYSFANNAESFGSAMSLVIGENVFDNVLTVGTTYTVGAQSYTLNNLNGNLTLTISRNTNPVVKGDIDGNGTADVILYHTKQGYSGAWLTTGDSSVIKWSSLANIKSGTEILGTGKLYGTTDDGQDIFFTNGKTVGSWNIVEGKVTGYKTIMNINSTTNVLGLGDFNGDGTTDILLRSTNGDLGFHNCDGSGWQYLKGLGQEWNISAIGDLNGDGLDDVVLQHDAGFAGTFLTQENSTVKWANLDTLKDGIKIVGTGDFNGDGIDDVLLQKADGWVGAWLVEDGTVTGFMGICKNKNTIEQIADFNGDGIDDLRIRTDKGDIGVLYVKGADTTEWQYFQSVGKEWDTSTSLLA